MNKKQLYESIMMSVAKEVKKALNEEFAKNEENLDEDWKGIALGAALGAASIFGGHSTAAAQYNGAPHSVEYQQHTGRGLKDKTITYNFKEATKVTPEMDKQFKKLCNNGRILQADNIFKDMFVPQIQEDDVHNGFGYSGGVVELNGNKLQMINQIQAVGASEMKMNGYKLAIVKYNGKYYLCGVTQRYNDMFSKLAS